MLFYILALSFQINSIFLVKDVQHLMKQRVENTNKISIRYGNLQEYDAVIISTKIPKHAILCYESDRLHIFLHDKKAICRCIWDGIINYNEKKHIMKNMLSWWIQNNSQLDQRVVNYEDSIVFSQVIKEINQ